MSKRMGGVRSGLPIYTTDLSGSDILVAYLRPLHPRGYFVELQPCSSPLLLGMNPSGFFDDLPYYLQDLRPQGFMGRQIARSLADQTGRFPADPSRWTSDHLGRYLLSNSGDLPGNFKLGEASHLRIRSKVISCSQEDYPGLADAVTIGELQVTSAGGDQPKFTAFCKEHTAHVIVKFSPRGDHPVARRWRDILITEFHAAESLRTHSFPVASLQLIEAENRLFLESKRFDRVGCHGRTSMISLQMIDAEFVGDGADWPAVMAHLMKQRRVSEEDYITACALWEFGFLINNTDMHLGNLSAGIHRNRFSLLPAYDMCSMGFAPLGGDVRPLQWSLNATHSRQNCLGHHATMKKTVLQMATEFWQRVSEDRRISDEFRSFLNMGNPVENIIKE